MTSSLSKYQEAIEKVLSNYQLPEQPANLYDPIRYFLNLGGKRMRPVLTLMSHELFHPEYNRAMAAALSIELFHNFSLIHDDIMDEAPLRRGKETVHSKWNSNIAILSGDVLLVEGFKLLTTYDGTVLKRTLELFNRTATEVCDGQQMDMDFESLDEVPIDDYLKMIRLKTAVLVGCSLEMGAIVGEASDSDCKELYNFGVNLGIAFQLQDDILDVYAHGDQFGKQIGGDIISNKKTYLLLRALEDADEEQKERLRALLQETDPQTKVKGVMALYEELNIREKATQRMNEYHATAMGNLNDIQVAEDKKEALRLLADFLLNRQH